MRDVVVSVKQYKMALNILYSMTVQAVPPAWHESALQRLRRMPARSRETPYAVYRL